MKETRLKQQESNIPPTDDLSTPHFDEFAIAAAQPVQPLLRRPRHTFGWPRVPRRAAVFGSAIVLLVGLSITAARQDNRATDMATNVLAQPDSLQVTEQPAAEMTESRAPAARSDRRGATQVAHRRYENAIRSFIPTNGKSVARKVGEIRY